MRHRVKGSKLSRTAPHRKATLRALSSALIKEHRIKTTHAKAKELRRFIEPLITTAKVDNTHNRRKVFSALQDKRAVSELFEVVSPAAADRPGGYTRVLKLGFRLGDSAELAVIELVDFNDIQPDKKAGKKKRTRRAGKSVKPDTKSETETVQKEEKPKAESKKHDPSEEKESKKPVASAEVDNEKTTEEDSAEETVETTETATDSDPDEKKVSSEKPSVSEKKEASSDNDEDSEEKKEDSK